ncbi:DnaJ domain-containing protein [Candidatus Electronema sp. JM]|uniref:DnaJ domain-containing protein n=1 Tax=Candidatus Electronema sp. JM TaxID=3401571 RepID=UPI003AA90592
MSRPTGSGCGGCLIIVIFLLFALQQFLQATGVEGLVFLIVLLPFLAVAAAVALFFGFARTMRKRAEAYERSQTESHNRFVYLLVNILVCIAKADGHFTQSELRTMLSFFQNSLHYNQEQIYWVKQLIKQAKDRQQNLESLLAEFRRDFDGYSLILLDLIYQIIYTKEPVLEQELHFVRRIAAFLQISPYERQTIENKYRYGSSSYQQRSRTAAGAAVLSERHYYTVLGVDEAADFAAIKKAYRTLSMQYHPDKVAHLGAEFKRAAEEKMKEINAAYDYFRKKFGN